MSQTKIHEAAKRYRIAKLKAINHPACARSVHQDDELSRDFNRVWADYEAALGTLMVACDVEYSKDSPLSVAAWNWMYWKNQSRKCCHIQLTRLWGHIRAGRIMGRFMDAEERLMEACNLPSALGYLGRLCSNGPKPSSVEYKSEHDVV